MKYSPKVSIVIRALNEERNLRELLNALKKQDYQGEIEFVVVDNESSDKTREVAKKFGAKVVVIRRNEFTYPKSMNLGIKKASGEIIILTVAHAIPLDDSWVSAGVEPFCDPGVAGVFGSVLAHKDANIFVKLYYYIYYYLPHKVKGTVVMASPQFNIFTANRVALRKDLWEIHHFDEQYEMGAEDKHWAEWAFSKGYKIVREPKFSVRHSHRANIFSIKNIKQTYRLIHPNYPSTFDRSQLSHREDIDLFN